MKQDYASWSSDRVPAGLAVAKHGSAGPAQQRTPASRGPGRAEA